VAQNVFQHTPPHDAKPNNGKFVFHKSLQISLSLTKVLNLKRKKQGILIRSNQFNRGLAIAKKRSVYAA
jgi:hypothetical protein